VIARGDPERLLASHQIPQANVPRVAGGQPGAARSDGDVPDVVLVAGQAGSLFTGRHVPDADRLVLAAGDEGLAVGRELQATSAPSVPCKGDDVPAADGVDQADGAVAADGGERLAVGGIAERPGEVLSRPKTAGAEQGACGERIAPGVEAGR